MSFRWQRRLRRSLFNLRLLISTMIVVLFLWATAPYDNSLRLSVRFNTQRLFNFFAGSLRSERWLYEEPAFPVDWSRDVAIILKTGYGTQERAVAWLDALPVGISPESVLVVGDFDSELRTTGRLPLNARVHDVVAGVLDEKYRPHHDSICQRIEKYRTLRAAIAAGEGALASNLSISFGWELDAMKFIPALELAYRTTPHKKWFILIDDDTYLIQPSLNLILGHFDPSLPHYLGNAVGDYRQRFAHGGSSITLSHATMQGLFAPRHHHVLAKARRASLTEIWGDRLLAHALLQLGIHIDEETSRFFNGEQPWASRLRDNRFCAPVATFHRLTTEEMTDVGNTFRKASDPVLWNDLWDIYGAPSLGTYEETPLQRDWDHVGRLDEHTTTVRGVETAAGCLRLCEAVRGCLACTWEEETTMCHLSPWVTVGKESRGSASGLHVDRLRRLTHVCTK